jgi:integrase
MGMRARRMCKKCYQNAEPGTSLCVKHTNADKIRDRGYKTANPLRPFYWTQRWKVIRRLVLARDPQCTHMEHGVRCVQLSTDVHHVIDAQTWVAQGGDFYDTDNLAGLCRPHHSRETAKDVGFAGWQKKRACKIPRATITRRPVSRGKESNMSAARYQTGSVVFDRRRGTWHFIWWADGKRHSQRIGTLAEFPTRTAAKTAAQPLQEKLWKPGALPTRPVSVAELVARYRAERMPARYSTRRSYNVWLDRYVLPRWGTLPITAMQAQPVELWLRSLPLAARSKSEVRALMGRLFDCAMWRADIPTQLNPMKLVRIPGASKRTKKPRSLTVAEFQKMLPHLPEPFRTIALVCACFGLRISECLGLRWSDVDWLDAKLSVQRGIVRNRVDDCKTVGSEQSLFISPEMLDVLKNWRQRSRFASESDWVFASPAQLGRLPWSADSVNDAYKKAASAGGIAHVSTHSMRHTFRSWLDAVGSSLTTQQKLMRHSDIRTTMNVYGMIVTDAMEQASTKVCGLALNGSRNGSQPS